jgi:hypothetical protein
MRAKVAQEELNREARVPFTIVHSTQFMEFLARVAGAGTEAGVRALPAQCDRQRGGGAVAVRGEGADRLGHETPVVS